MEIYLIIAQVLATYVITAVLMYSGGPWGALEAIRNIRAVKHFGLLECFPCASFWVALILTLFIGGTWWSFFIAWGIAYLIDQLVTAYKLK